MAKHQLWWPRRLPQRLQPRRVARLEELRREPLEIRRSIVLHVWDGIVPTPTKGGARSTASHAEDQDLEDQPSHENLIEKTVTDITMPKKQNVPYRDDVYLPYQSFEQMKKRQRVTERQSVPKNAVQLPEPRSSAR